MSNSKNTQKKLKTIKVLFISVIVQSALLILVMPSDLEFFFLCWAFIFLVLFIYTTFNIDCFEGISGDAGDSNQGLYSALAQQMLSKESNNSLVKSFLTPTTLSFLLMTLLNVVIYIVVMPK